MTTFRANARLVAATAALCMTVQILMFAQAAGQDQPPARPARGQAGATRPALPPVGRGMNAMQLQQHLDAFALIQAEQQLKLSTEQYSAFAPKLIRLQTVRRRMMQARRRLLNELNQLKKSTSHLALGVFYAKVGLVTDAEREFHTLIQLNPQSDLPRKLLQSVRKLRKAN